MKELLEQLGFVENHIEFEKEEKRVYLPMLSEFVKSNRESVDDCEFLMKQLGDIDKYTDFITQPLTKGMFIPCDEDGNVLEEPREDNAKYWVHKDTFRNTIFNADLSKYQQALERVLFENEILDSGGDLFWIDEIIDVTRFKTIEQAINNGVKLYLR